jgi:hypothetical protein
MATVTLDIVTVGWELPGWEQSFYPDDLPLDWRLTYFANELSAVMVPSQSWGKASASQLRTWYEDVHEGFRFYLDDPRPQAALAAPDLARDILGAKLGGLVLHEGAQHLRVGQVSLFRFIDERNAVPAADYLPAWRISSTLIGDLRAARALLQTFAAQALGGHGLLVLTGEDIEIEDLRRWWDLARLMGLAG